MNWSLKKASPAHFLKHYLLFLLSMNYQQHVMDGIGVQCYSFVNIIYSHAPSLTKAILTSNLNLSRVFTVKKLYRKNKIIICLPCYPQNYSAQINIKTMQSKEQRLLEMVVLFMKFKSWNNDWWNRGKLAFPKFHKFIKSFILL